MEILKPYVILSREYLDFYIKQAEKLFISSTEGLDFTIFCIIYAVLLIWILKKFNRQAIFRPKNRELISWKERTKKRISSFIVSLPIVKQYTNRKFNQAMLKVQEELYNDFEKYRDPLKSKKLPTEGMKQSNIQARINKWVEQQNKVMFTGKSSGAIYPETLEHCQQVSTFAAKYMYHNPLHLDTFKQVSKMQAELLKMTANLVTKNRAYGVITSGGSESLIMSLYAYRNYFNKPKPNIVVPNTIHAALDKGAMYFNVQLRKAKLNENYEVDVKHMESLIDSNTIAIYGSYPNFPHGIIDPVEDLAALAVKYKIGFHLDGCLGGLVAGFLKQHQKRFTLDIEGITSISLDHHKFGLAPKGISAILYKTRQMRQHMYYINSDWIGGVYATPSFPGSRSGFASAGAWYAFTHTGRKTFLQNAMGVSRATKKLAQQLSKIDDITVLGKPEVCALAFTTSKVDPFIVKEFLQKQKHWKISASHCPKALHLSVTVANYENVQKYLARDVKAVMQLLKSLPPQKATTEAALYGANATLPSESMGQEMIKIIISTSLRA